VPVAAECRATRQERVGRDGRDQSAGHVTRKDLRGPTYR
jgi:hypothetical protein